MHWTRTISQAATRHWVGTVGALIVLTVIAVAVVAPFLAPYPAAAQVATRLQPPNRQFLLGTDEFGRDVLSRVIYGSRISLYVGIVSVGISLLFGGSLGTVAAFFGGLTDNIIMRLMDLLFSIPSLILAIVITGTLRPSLTNAMLAIGIVYTPRFARVARGPALSVMREAYVEAAWMIGAGRLRIMLSHLLPNIVAPLIVQSTLAFSTAILTEAALSFLGLGTQPPDPSWGTMLGTGRKYMELAPWIAVFPGLAIMLAVLGFNLLGDGLRDFFDPRLRRSRR
jgi:peptide/nickel transport system permease protein